MHYYQFNIADYRADTAHLSIVEHGIYRQLIDWYYLDEKPIPKETQVVMRRLRLGSDEVHFLTNVLSDFFILTDLGYLHSRIEIELEHYRAQFAKNRVNGKLGGRPPKTHVVSKNNHMATQINPNQEPRTNNQEPITIKKHTQKNEFFADIDQTIVSDYLLVRKSKKATSVTKTVYEGLVRESNLAGITLEAALKVCCERNWVGFKADWFLDKKNVADGNRFVKQAEELKEYNQITREAARIKLFGLDNFQTEKDISNETTRL